MGFRPNCYAKVWDVKPSERGYASTGLRITISRKNKKTGDYEDDFSGYVDCYNTAHSKISSLPIVAGDRIKLLETDVCRVYNKETGKERISFKVYDLEKAEPFTNAGNGGSADTPYEGTTGDLDRNGGTADSTAYPF